MRKVLLISPKHVVFNETVRKNCQKWQKLKKQVEKDDHDVVVIADDGARNNNQERTLDFDLGVPVVQVRRFRTRVG